MKTFTKEELLGMVSEFEKEFTSLIKSEIETTAQPLAKSEDEPAKEEEKETAQEEAQEEQKEEQKEESAEKSEDEEKKDEDKDEDSHGYDDEDLEELHKMYSSMSKGERKAHLEAINKCGEMTQMAKSEEASTEEKIEEKSEETSEETLLKSELESVKKENEDLKKNVEGLVSALNTFMTKQVPARKAITNLEFVKKSEMGEEEKPLTKSEINSVLAKKVASPTLSNEDRKAINEYYLNGASVEKIQHLLKK